MTYKKRLILGGFVLASLAVSAPSQACSTGAWSDDSNAAPNALAASPLEGASRYSQLCALAVSDIGYVQSNLASDARYFGRFYVYVDTSGTDTIDLLVAYSDNEATAELFSVRTDGASVFFDATGGAGGSSGSASLENGWNLVEFEFNSGNSFNFWVNEDWDIPGAAYLTGPSGTFNSGAGTVEAVQLGAPNGVGNHAGANNFIYFDAFESHRTTNVGGLLVGDANGNGSLTIADVITVGNELNGTLGIGQPDCNENGSITIADVICVGNKL
jgi:hypothetical protein